MALLMTVFFENGFSENYFPNVDNRNFPIAIRPYVSGLKEELVLNAEVWDGQWKLRRSPQYSLILKGDPVESADLKDGTVIEGMVTKTDLYFSVKIDQVQREHVNFEKYMLKEGSIFKLEIGSDDLCNIVYKNRFVTGSHAEITFESGAAYITDKNSVNGTFLNGRLVREKTKLHYGDIIYVVGLKIVYLNNLLAINNPNNQCRIRELKAVEIPHFEDEPAEDADTEDVYFLRTPRKLLNLDKEKISHSLEHIRVNGRMEIVYTSERCTVLVDYAHNAVSMESLLSTLRDYKPKRLVCVFGCGGNRSKDRRYSMGEIGGKMADLSIITADNSRYEKVEDIIADIRGSIEKTGGKFIEIPDRREAIRYSILHAQPGDMVAVIGKGHEDYQEINGVRHHFLDREVIEETVKELGEKA